MADPEDTVLSTRSLTERKGHNVMVHLNLAGFGVTYGHTLPPWVQSKALGYDHALCKHSHFWSEPREAGGLYSNGKHTQGKDTLLSTGASL